MAKITVAYFRKIYNDFLNEKITMSRMIELLNEKANQEELKCKSCGNVLEDYAIIETGLCTACFTCNA